MFMPFSPLHNRRNRVHIPSQWGLVISLMVQIAGVVAVAGYLSYRSGQHVAIAPLQNIYGLKWPILTVITELDVMAATQGNALASPLSWLLALGGAVLLGWAVTCRMMASSDRNNLELALQASEVKLNDVLNSARFASIVSFRVFPDRSWEYEYQSPGCEVVFGYTADEICGDQHLWMSRVFASDRETILYPLFADLLQGHSKTVEFRFHHKDNSLRWISATYTSRYDTIHNCWSVTGVSTDITERKHIEQSLQASEAQLRLVLDASRTGTWDWDISTGKTTWSYNLEAMFGLAPGEFDGSYDMFVSCLHPDDRDRVQAAIQQSVTTGENYEIEFRVIHRDGSIRWALSKGKVFYGSDGQPVRMAGIDIDITDRKQIEITLQKTLWELTHHVENSPLATIQWDREFRVESWSKQAEQIFGWTAAEILGKTMHDWPFIVEDDREHVNQVAAQLLQGMSTICQNRNYRKDGSVVHCEWYNSILLDEDGKLVSILSLVQDVSDRNLSQAALAQEILRRQALFDASIDGIIILDQQGNVMEANRRFAQMTGYATEELLNLNVLDLDALVPPTEMAQKIETGNLCHNTFETQHRRKDGSIYDVEISSNSIHWHGQSVQLCICRDISDRKQTELALRHSESALAEAQRVAHVGSWEFYIPTQTITWSEELFRMFGLDPAQPEPSYSDYLHHCIYPADQEKLEQCVTGAIADGHSYVLDYRAVLPDGSIRYHEGRGEAEYDPQGHVIRLFGTAQDITERKRVEQELERAKDAAETANRTKSVFLSTMSHELRTPLNVILGFTQLMTQDMTLASEHQEYIQLIHKNGSHLLRLINDVLDLSRIEAGKLSLNPQLVDLFNLLESLNSSFKQQAHKRRLQFHLQIAPDVPQHIVVDAQKLQQILLNLLGNAIKFTQSGQITLHVRLTETVAQAIAPSPLALSFEVTDTGIGIAAQDLHTIFDAFSQVTSGHNAQEGSGLGLAISRHLVQIMGGEITVHSTVGQGSRFQFWVLVEPVQISPNLKEHSHQRIVGVIPNASPFRILVVDDQHENCLLLQKLLQPLGFEVEAISTGVEALQVWRQWHPHLIWMDLRMPGLDGYTLTQAIRREEQSLPQRVPCVIIALTAQASPEDRDRALATGCNDYLSKPFQMETVLSKLAKHLDVQYRYADTPSTPGLESVPAQALTPESLAVMPQEWIMELYQVTLSCEQYAVQNLIRQIPAEYGFLSFQLEQLAHDFDFATILQLTQAYLTQPESQDPS